MFDPETHDKSYPLFRRPPGYRKVSPNGATFCHADIYLKPFDVDVDWGTIRTSPWYQKFMTHQNTHGMDQIYGNRSPNELYGHTGYIPSFGASNCSSREVARSYRFGSNQMVTRSSWRFFTLDTGNFDCAVMPINCCRKSWMLPMATNLQTKLPTVTDGGDDDFDGCFKINNEEEHKVMDGATRLENRKYLPLDIGRSFISEIVPYYRDVFGMLPLEYASIDFATYGTTDTERKLRLGNVMKNIESKFTVLNKFQYRLSDAEIVGYKLGKEEIGEVNYVLDGGILLNINLPYHTYLLFYQNKEQFDKVQECIEYYPKKRKKKEPPTFQLLSYGNGSFNLTKLELKDFDIDLKLNYNDDLPDKQIKTFLRENRSSGICMLYGIPGTGKTYYIRHLIKSMKDLNFIYMNKECLLHITDSAFVDFLIKHKNSVFIMEDCENVLRDRTEYNNTISTLLNLSDGIIGDAFNNKFICTFNTDISLIDKALLRQGRMRLGYEFGKLSKDKANTLARKNGLDNIFDNDVPLCQVLNINDNGEEKINCKKVKIGF